MIIGFSMPFFLGEILIYNLVDESKIIPVNPVLLFFVFMVFEIITDYPVYLGYSLTTFPDRCKFVSKVMVTILLQVWIINIIAWLKRKKFKEIVFSKTYCVTVAFIVFMAFIPFMSIESMQHYFPMRIYHDLVTGELEIYESANNIIFSALDNAQNEDVVIDIYEYNDLDYLESLRLQSDPNYWVNKTVSKHYPNVDSISVNYK